MRTKLAVIVVLICSAFREEDSAYPFVRNESYSRGEVINFKMTFGIFTVGKGSVIIDSAYHKLNNRDCFKIDVYGRTVGMVDWVANVDDHYGAYIDTAAIVPHQFYRFVRQGKYRKDEWTNFDHINRKIEVKTKDNKTGKMKDPHKYSAPGQVRDMIAGFMYLRNMDLSAIKEKDTVVLKGFYEDEFYNFKIVYAGKQTIKVKAGRIRTLVFRPVMPKNKVFKEENSVTAWFSDDKNRIPVKIDADMLIGSAGVELIGYSGLRNPLNTVNK